MKSENTPIDYKTVKSKIEATGSTCIGRSTIRELVKLVNEIEKATGEKYIRMEMGVPGLPVPEVGINAEIEAIKSGVNSKYPMLEGLPELKNEISRFVKMFLNTDVDPYGCIPTVGSTQGSMACFITLDNMWEDRDTVLFIDPGFPVHKQQRDIFGKKSETFDVYNFRGEKLRAKLESIVSKGNIHSILYSNPNNPSWICFTEQELQIIGDIANKYDIVILEDLAYFGMDFRKDYSKPGVPPFQPTVASYTENVIHLISGSKMFSYPGPRLGMMAMSNKLQHLKNPALKRFFKTDVFGYSMIYGTIYAMTAGASNSAQYGLAAILKAVNDGTYNFKDDVIEYGKKAAIMKKLFTSNGFSIVYDQDDGEPLADGFYFTISYPGMDGVDLVEKLLYYGISAISLATARSERTEGLRVCVSLVRREQFGDLELRLKKFREDHP
jgi:aspartate/methionine/tyrosine aminotransferase